MSGPRRPTDPAGLERHDVVTGGRSGPGGAAAGLDVATLVDTRRLASGFRAIEETERQDVLHHLKERAAALRTR
ncbi:hypothetical protein [Streptomyces atriruber]|uniref:hypothetical protein n=1 Tax=Streptomyces atriruber TaxID=545121 RepID=UPI0006E34353|nr:hypothetical protein [Streptomyces atriruber]